MANKTTFLSSISTALSVVITKAKVLLSFDEVADELYPASVTDTQITETYTTKAGTAITYSLRLIKSGNIVRLQGTIATTSITSLSPQNVFTWNNTEYKPKSGVNDFTFNAWSSSGGRLPLFLSNNVLAITGAMPANSTYKFEYTTYIAQD